MPGGSSSGRWSPGTAETIKQVRNRRRRGRLDAHFEQAMRVLAVFQGYVTLEELCRQRLEVAFHGGERRGFVGAEQTVVNPEDDLARAESDAVERRLPFQL